MNVQTSTPLVTARANATAVEIILPNNIGRIEVRLDNGVDEVGNDSVYKSVFFSAPSTGSKAAAGDIPVMIAAYAEAARFAAVLMSAIGREAYPANPQDRFDVRALLVAAAEVA